MLKRVVRWLLVVIALLGALIAVVVLTLRPPAPLVVAQQDIVLSGVTVVNPGVDRHAGQRVAIHGSAIEAIIDDTPEAAAPPNTHRYPGAYVLPGLIDMHVHHPPARAVADTQLFGLLYLAHGVTTVRDTGNIDGSILATREQILNGQYAGPRIFACGPILDGDPAVWPGSKVVHTAEEAERAVDEIAATGVHCIKAYQNLTADALRGLRAAATRHHVPLIGHVPFAVPLEEAHLDDIQHLTGLAALREQIAPSPPELVRALLRSWADLDHARVRSGVRTSIEQRLIHTPTIVVIDQLSRLTDYSQLVLEPEARMLPRYYREILWRQWGASEIANGRWPDGQLVRSNFRNVVRQLRDAGVTVHVGTDVLNPFVIPGTSMHQELRNLTECGFTPEQAWAAATRDNGASLPEPQLGVIETGAPADLLVFRDDPTRDLAALSTLEAVVANGRFYSKATLDEAVARYRGKFDGWLYDHLTQLIVQASTRQ